MVTVRPPSIAAGIKQFRVVATASGLPTVTATSATNVLELKGLRRWAMTRQC